MLIRSAQVTAIYQISLYHFNAIMVCKIRQAVHSKFPLPIQITLKTKFTFSDQKYKLDLQRQFLEIFTYSFVDI